MEAAESLFESLRKWSDVERLVDEATPESVYLECKTQTGVQLNQGVKNQLAATISAMSNASGGVILLGVATSAVKAHSLDVISGLEPIGNVMKLVARIQNELPMLTVPPVLGARVRGVLQGKSKRGVVAIFVPPSPGDPFRSATDQHFYFRGSDGDMKAPYEVIRRLFSASDVPDLAVRIDKRLNRRKKDGSYELPIIVENRSTATARDARVAVIVENYESFLSITSREFEDHSHVNPGTKHFHSPPISVVYRGMNMVVGRLIVRKTEAKWPRRVLRITVVLLADRMRGRRFQIRANLKKAGLEVTASGNSEPIY